MRLHGGLGSLQGRHILRCYKVWVSVYISRVYIKNFRNFSECDVTLAQTLTCIVGSNASGKSNFIDAIRLCLDSSYSFYRKLQETDFHKQIGPTTLTDIIIAVEFSDLDNPEQALQSVGEWVINGGQQARLIYRFRPKREIRDAIAAKTKSADRLTLADYKYYLRGGGDGKDPSTVEWDDEFGVPVSEADLQSFQLAVLPALRDAARDMRNTRLSPLHKMIEAINPPETEQTAILDAIRRVNEEVRKRQFILDLESAIDKSYNTLAGLGSATKLELGISDPNFRTFLRSLGILLSDAGLSAFDVDRNSDGHNNILYMSLLAEQFRRRATQGAAGQLLVVEEPEAHLHPQAQVAVTNALQSQPFQTILTSHSPAVSAKVGAASLVCMSQLYDGSTSVQRLASRFNHTEIDGLDRLLQVSQAAILFAQRCLLVEGQAEFFLIPTLLQNVGIDIATHHITLIAVGGTFFSAYHKLFSPDALKSHCAIIRDGDKHTVDGMVCAIYDSGDNIFPPPPPESQVATFSNLTTFEMALCQDSTLGHIEDVLSELSYPRILKRFTAARSKYEIDGAISNLQILTLLAAMRCGKPRFAQLLARQLRGSSFCPEYVRLAAEWLLKQRPFLT